MLARSGFYDRNRIAVIVAEEMYAPGDLNLVDVKSAIDLEIRELESEKASWPEVTDCDRLDTAFKRINSRGVIALQNAGYTQSDGYDDFLDVLKARGSERSVLGYCFYHGQDLERAVLGLGLYLSFGPTRADEEQQRGPVVGSIVREELQRCGFEVEWDGTFATRILIPRIDWKRRGAV